MIFGVFNVLKFFSLLFCFAVLFSTIPKFAFIYVKRLLHFNPSHSIKQELNNIVPTYILLTLAIGFVFNFLFFNRLNLLPASESQSITNVNIVFGSFFASFGFLFVVRLSTLLNKTVLLLKILEGSPANKIKEYASTFDYSSFKEEIKSFLFSFFLLALLSLLMYFIYLIFYKPSVIFHLNLDVTTNGIGILNGFLTFLGICILLLFISWFGEWLLKRFGAH